MRYALPLLAVLSGCHSAAPEPAPRPSGAAVTAESAAVAPPGVPAPTLALEFVEITTGHARSTDPLPLVIALHGLGDNPRSFLGAFDGFPHDARVVAPHSATPYSDGYAWF